ncbi:hypothetical protein EJ02DRAFT_459764 [Clathrospora elynae]|uniref:Uncharacterized protein n=1 Tax=Clathrospora elynae TaxID=706981 RepID=A0A6A5SFI0_9PLEO|nr:hypothetical protein EJ02DRAFT_459764 [Clathrospora elynae]
MYSIHQALTALSLVDTTANTQPPDTIPTSPMTSEPSNAKQTLSESKTLPQCFSDSNPATESEAPATTSETDTMPKRNRNSDIGAMSVISSMPMDPIIKALHDFIQEERKRDFSFLAQYSHCYKDQTELLVVSRADVDDVSPILKAAGSTAIANLADWYIFTEPLRTDGFARTVAIQVAPGSITTVKKMTIVDFCKKHVTSVPAATWIRDTYGGDDMWAMKFTEMQYEEQRKWWSSTSQSFRLLDLPAEMREAIYLQIIGPIVVPDVITYPKKKVIIGTGLSIGDESRTGLNSDPDVKGPNMRIMLVCKQVLAEATTVAHRDTTKRFTTLGSKRGDPYADERMGPQSTAGVIWGSATRFAPHAAFLRHIQLEMSAAQYFEFIGIRPRTGSPLLTGQHSALHIGTLRRFTALKTLDFRFISPKHKDARCPWATTGFAMAAPRLLTTHSCQKKWIRWFFVFAFPSLQLLKTSKGVKFSLSGCVKTSTRTYWERVLNDIRVDEYATIKFLKQQILQMMQTDDNAIECQCSNSCASVGGPKLFQCSEYEVRMIEGLQEEIDKAYWDYED